VNINEIKELIKVITQSNIEEFELERAGIKIRIRNRTSSLRESQELDDSQPVERVKEKKKMSEEVISAKEESVPTVKAENDNLSYITSPIVGTFYRASNPNATPYVEIGDRVKAGQVMCLIEAMKLMNEIVADKPGEVVGILPKNGQPVEYGEKLFALRLI